MNVFQRFLLTDKAIVMAGFFLLLSCFAESAMGGDRFVNNGDGTVTDHDAGLMWAEKDNGIPINWPNGNSYCQNYKGAGYTDWRLPTLEELAGLYYPEAKNQRGYHIVKWIEITADTCWASETRNYESGRFNFRYGSVHWLRQSYSGPTRALPVRRIK